MANGEQRRTADGKCRMLHGRWRMANWQHSPALSLSVSLSPPFVLSLSILCLLCCFSRCFSCCFLVLWLPTRRHVWLPLDFRHDFLSRTSLLTPLPCTFPLPPFLLPFPYAICVLPFTFFVAFFVGIFCARWPKVNP